MAAGKLFIGRKVRELRLASKATQGQFAERLGISTSYLNQIESNQRPVSASVLVALVDKFKLDFSELASGETDRLLSALSEALADPLFKAYTPSLQELKLITQNAPGFAHALITAHQAYLRNSEQLAGMDDRLARAPLSDATPYDEVRDFFHFVDNYLHDIDTAAEKLALDCSFQRGDSQAILADYLEKQFSVRVVQGPAAMSAIRSYDPTGRLLMLNTYAPVQTRTFQMAVQIAQLHAGALIDETVRHAGFRSEEAVEICRIGLHNYFAGALLMPYESFLNAARELRHDIELLAIRFSVSLEQVCHRLSTMQRPGFKGVPIFFAKIDRAGNIAKRHSATKLQFARFGAACSLWNAHQAFEAPGRIIRQLAETPDGVRYLCLATHVIKGRGGFQTLQPSYALALGCEIAYADAFVYADDLNLGDRTRFDPIGISCRICERSNCASRALPPFKRKLTIDHHTRFTVPYEV